jgi:prepilin-type N-terminal cleavage/methylation domain-containing protein
MTRSKQNGFTLIELLVVITIIGILAAIALPNYIKAKDKAKEAEVKSACHTIQIALERYATDHSGKYPKQIYGGDKRGWSPEMIDGWPYGCWAVWWAVDNDIPIPFDPLVHLGYVESYPNNAFIDPGEGRTSVIFWTGGSHTLGLGDPRFGYTGELMGNCLNDPRYLWEKDPFVDNLQIGPEYYHIYQWIGTQNNYTAMREDRTPNNPFYGMGGLPQWSRTSLGDSDLASGQTINAFWAGEFFYRSGGDFFLISPQAAATGDIQYEYIWDMPFQRITRYMLGGYGSPRTQGIDVIRLTCVSGDAANNYSGVIDDPCSGDVYETHQEFKDNGGAPFWEVLISTPEVMGGGSRGTAPVFPYWKPFNREWLYGAPDGFKDGVIITLIAGSDSAKFGDA